MREGMRERGGSVERGRHREGGGKGCVDGARRVRHLQEGGPGGREGERWERQGAAASRRMDYLHMKNPAFNLVACKLRVAARLPAV